MVTGGKGGGEGELGSLGLTSTHSAIFKIDNQQGPTI